MGQGYYEIIRKGNKMKLVSFSRLGKARFGAVVKDGVIDLTGKLDPDVNTCLLYTSPSPRDVEESRMPSSA